MVKKKDMEQTHHVFFFYKVNSDETCRGSCRVLHGVVVLPISDFSRNPENRYCNYRMSKLTNLQWVQWHVTRSLNTVHVIV